MQNVASRLGEAGFDAQGVRRVGTENALRILR
jgi:hypothetical protein